MNKNQILTSVRRQSSAILKKKLTTELSEEEKQTIELVLRQRGVLDEDLGNKEDLEVIKLTKDQINKIDKVIIEVCEINNQKLTDGVGKILDTVEEYSDLTLDQALQIEKLLVMFKRDKKKISSQITLSNSSTTPSKKRKGVELTEFQKEFLQQKLSELELGTKTKHEIIISLMEFGITKQQIDKNVDDKVLHWSTVYSIYRENGK